MRFLSLFLLAFVSNLSPNARAASPAPPLPRLSIADATISEGNSGFRDLEFVATIPQAVGFEVTAKAETIDMTAKAGSDYTASTGNRVVIPAGKTSGLLKIRVSTDGIEERDEQFRIRMFDATGATLLDGDALGNINDDDYAGEITVADASISEGTSGQKLVKSTVRLSQAPLHPIEVRFETKDGTAKTPADYLQTKGALLFKPGRLALDALTPIIGDPFIEADKTFSVNLLVTGLRVAKSRGIVTIVSDDRPGVPKSGGPGKIVYVVGSNGVGPIYTANADGSHPKRISPPDARDGSPRLSPDGKRIVFTSSPDLGFNIYSMNADGTDRKRLTNNFADRGPNFSPDGKRIVWSALVPSETPSESSIHDQIWVMNADGSNQKALTSGAGSKYTPSFSPDGQKIVFIFARDLGGRIDNDIAVMGADGQGFFPLTKSDGLYETKPTYSPDGTKITFASYRYAPSLIADIYVMNDNGASPVCLTDPAPSYVSDAEPSFSPDGQRIAFSSNRDSNQAIFVMNFNGSGQTRVTTGDNHYSPSWALGTVPPSLPPAGLSGKIAYRSDIGGGAREIFIINADGSHATRLTTSGRESHPRLSRDGNQIVFESQRQSQGDIYKMKADGTEVVRLTKDGTSHTPSWSPDGQKIAYTSFRDGFPQIYVMNADGTGQTRLSSSRSGYDRENPPGTLPAWSPDGQKIIYKSDGERGRIYLMNADGTDRTLIDHEISGAGSNYLSPDGAQIVFISMRDGDERVWLIGADGSNPICLTTPENSDFSAAISSCFSPGGGQIAFTGIRSRDAQIYVMNRDGSHQFAVTRVGVNDQASWAPGSVSAPPAASRVPAARAVPSSGAS